MSEKIGPSEDLREYGLAEMLVFGSEMASICWARRSLFGKSLAMCLTICMLYLWGSKREYAVTTKILPYSSERSTFDGLSSLAGAAGVNLQLGTSGKVLPTELYTEVANSFAFRSNLAVRQINFSAGHHSYDEYFDSVYRASPIELMTKYVLLLPFTASSALRARLTPSTEASPRNGHLLDSLGIRSHSVAFVKRVEGMKARVEIIQSKKTGIIAVTARMPDPVAAADLARITADQLTAEIIRYESTQAAEQARFLKKQQQSAEIRYKASQRALAEFQDRNKSLSSAVSQIELQRLQSDFSLASDLYKNITNQYEAARVKQFEDTPVLTVLEPSVIPNVPSEPRAIRLVLFSTLLGIIAPGAWLVIAHLAAPTIDVAQSQGKS